ncbi:MAG: hypothetical protein C4K49_10690 [Candidatus Thorarchaeota archaeon]|nr:MAG: hypothetical protein C4K49_10690 [Candidatus Thorarchaeota archaeon]
MLRNFGVIFVLVFVAVVVVWMVRDAMKKLNVDCDRLVPFDYDEGPKRLYRICVYVIEVNKQAANFSFIIPGRYKDRKIILPLRDLPEKLREAICSGKYLYVRANIKASDIEDLWFEGWGEV